MKAGGRLLRFLVAGGLATLVFLVLSYLLLKAGWRPFAANLAAYAAGFVVGYVLQRGWTFQAQHAHAHALPRYLLVQLLCGGLTALVGEVGGSVLHLPPLAVSLGSTAFTAVFSYTASSLWVFRVRGA